MWATVGKNVGSYRNYPRIVGETGGKDFILAHPSADAEAVATAVVRGSFEYQGQKCSASSRLYVPSNLSPRSRSAWSRTWARSRWRRLRLRELHGRGDRLERVQDARAGDRGGALGRRGDRRRGSTDDSEGYFVSPTVIATDDKGFRLLRDELFGPIVTTYVYDEKRWGDTLELVDETAPYGLTGAVFATDRAQSTRRRTHFATRPATSTSTTSRPARSSVSSPSAALARVGRTTRPARCGT